MQDSVRRVLSEDVLTIPQAADRVGEITGKRPDRATVYRWTQRGVRGVRLESVSVGGHLVTSDQALTRFFDEQTVAREVSA
jgi:hypothetical protein